MVDTVARNGMTLIETEKLDALVKALTDGRDAMMNVRTFCPNHAQWPWVEAWFQRTRLALEAARPPAAATVVAVLEYDAATDELHDCSAAPAAPTTAGTSSRKTKATAPTAATAG